MLKYTNIIVIITASSYFFYVLCTSSFVPHFSYCTPQFSERNIHHE